MALITIAVGAIAYYADPEQVDWMPKCVFHALTGLNCPSCGSTRAIHALLHGHFHTALAYNPFVLISWPLTVVVIWMAIFKPKRLTGRDASVAIWIYVAMFVMWWVVRNILGI